MEEIYNLQFHKVIDSILNTVKEIAVIIDIDSFEIIYQNSKAYEVMGNRIGQTCHDLLCLNDVPCIECPVGLMGDTTVVREKYVELFDTNIRLTYNKIDWYDSKKALLATIKGVNKANEDISTAAIQRVTAKLEETYKEKDPLTGLPNYSKFYSDAETVIRNNPDKDYAIVVFDIERFKSINDIYGMLEGDEAIKHIAQCLEKCFEGKKNYSRMHSDIFAYYIDYKNKGQIIKGIEKLRKLINANSFDFDINTTYGIYLATERNVPINLMCDRASLACKTIKGNIMKFCAFYDEQYREDMLKINSIEKDMYKALENHEFKMYLQPKYTLSDGLLCGAEVLCRWFHPQKGMIPPNDFIPLFERNGFILRLDEYMWEEACKTIRGWLDEGRKPVPLSVNISRYHIKHNDLELVLLKLLKKYDLSPEYLTLEITESLFLDKPEELNRVLVKLQNHGFKLEVDDFGAGFSSLNLIRNITVDTIKMDKEFLDNEIASEKGKIVVNHTIDMAKDLNLLVVAEGVETEEQVEFLKQSNCDIAQGFFYAKPMPLEAFNETCF
ncbi:MAG: bifunctional diguanylate cyclase/phosphodiesterase [Lachnospiraceae bacterium]|nr:bifunctional diguanylate cyclase/phosphodiesterase [Lachnospiraceae bacterium]